MELERAPSFQPCFQACTITKLCPTLCDSMDCGTPGLPVLHHLLELAQTHVHWVGDAIQPSHPLLPSSPPALNLSQHQGLFQWVSSSHQMAKVLLPWVNKNKAYKKHCPVLGDKRQSCGFCGSPFLGPWGTAFLCPSSSWGGAGDLL